MEPAAALRKMRETRGQTRFNDLILSGRPLSRNTRMSILISRRTKSRLGRRHVGFAVALEQGLTVPVIRNADRKSLSEIGAEAKDLAEKARAGKLQMTDIQGGGITVSNLGMFDVENFTAIINPPQSAILAVSSIRKKPIVDGDTVRPGLRMNATLSSDHRMVDGVLAARFMKTVKDLLENPTDWT
jgi:pyruvate dehydrogenase E2 component (dihydrolipoamide acetyltransferase)